MLQSIKVQEIMSKTNQKSTKLGDLKKIAKGLKKDHELALELWTTEQYFPRLLSVLIMDKKRLTENVINKLVKDMQTHVEIEMHQLADWLLANQLMKDKTLVSLLESWEENPSPVLRRLFWYHQARLRWTGQTPPPNTPLLLASIEKDIKKAEPSVQWAMNFCAGQIGIYEPEYRARCIQLGKDLGLYQDEIVSKGCTSNYLPEFISHGVAKLSKKA